MELPPVLRLAVPDCGDRVLGGFDRIKALHEVRAVRENRKTREDVEMLLVVRRADEEKVPRRLAVRRTEEDRMDAPAVCVNCRPLNYASGVRPSVA